MVNIRAIGQKFTKSEGKDLLDKAQKIISGEIKVKPKKRQDLLQTPEVKATVDGQAATVKEGTDTLVTANKKIPEPKIDPSKADDILFKVTNSKLTPKQLSDFNIEKLNTSENILKFIEEVSQTFKKDINKQKRGVQTNQATQEMADLLQLSPKKLTSTLLQVKPGQTLNAETILAAREVLVAAMGRLDELAIKAVNGTPDDLLKFRQHMALTAELQKIVKGVQTETARALQQFQIPTRNKQFTNVSLEDLNKQTLLVELGGEDEIRGVAHLYLRSGTQKERAKITAGVGTLTKVSQAMSEIFVNAVLSNPMTHVKNTAGNWITQGIIATEKKIASRLFGDATKGVAEYEDLAKAFGKSQAFKEMWASIGKSLKKGEMPTIENTVTGSKIDTRANVASAANFNITNKTAADFFDLTAKILTVNRIPTKFLTVADNFFKNMEYRSELYALAYRDTVQKVRTGVLKQENAAEYLADLVANPNKTIADEAFKAAQYSTFQTPLGTRGDFLDIAASAQKFKSGSGAANFLVNYYLTFLQTPTNVAGFAIERMPGLNLLLKSYRDDLFAGGARSQTAKAKMMLGAAFFTTVMAMTNEGYIRGTSPKLGMNYKSLGSKYGMEKTLGLDPGSLVFGDYQIDLNVVTPDPLAMYIKQAADFTEILQAAYNDHDQWEDATKYLAAFLYSTGENIGNSTMMAGFGKFVDDYQMIKDRGLVSASKEISKKMIIGLIPAGYKLPFQLASDDKRKVAVEFNEYLQKALYDKNLNKEYDYLGDEIEKAGWVTKEKKDPIRDELRNLGVEIRPMKKTTTIPYGDGQLKVPVEFNSKELSFMQQRAGQYAKEGLDKLFNSGFYQDADTDLYWKQTAVQQIFSEARKASYADLVNAGDRRSDYYEDFASVRTRIQSEADQAALSKLTTSNQGQPLKGEYNLDAQQGANE